MENFNLIPLLMLLSLAKLLQSSDKDTWKDWFSESEKDSIKILYCEFCKTLLEQLLGYLQHIMFECVEDNLGAALKVFCKIQTYVHVQIY